MKTLKFDTMQGLLLLVDEIAKKKIEKERAEGMDRPSKGNDLYGKIRSQD